MSATRHPARSEPDRSEPARSEPAPSEYVIETVALTKR